VGPSPQPAPSGCQTQRIPNSYLVSSCPTAQVGATCFVSCQSGYQRSPPDGVAVCDANGIFSGVACVPESLPNAPPPPANSQRPPETHTEPNNSDTGGQDTALADDDKVLFYLPVVMLVIVLIGAVLLYLTCCKKRTKLGVKSFDGSMPSIYGVSDDPSETL
jgi:hypothetical protein